VQPRRGGRGREENDQKQAGMAQCSRPNLVWPLFPRQGGLEDMELSVQTQSSPVRRGEGEERGGMDPHARSQVLTTCSLFFTLTLTLSLTLSFLLVTLFISFSPPSLAVHVVCSF